MSETVTEETPAVIEESPAQALPETPPAEAAPDAAPIKTQPEKPKPNRPDRHIANLTARLASETAEREAQQRRADAAEAMLRSNGAEATETPADQRGETVEQAATRLIAQRQFDESRATLIASGKKEFGPDVWDEKTAILHGLGATGNQAFMQALVDLPNAAKIVSELADDSDTLVALLAKSPASIAAQLGRMDAKMDVAPKVTLSNAPKPPSRIAAETVLAEADWYDPNLSMAEWNKLADKNLPRRHGGQRPD